MMPARLPSTVDTVTAVVQTVRSERVTSLLALEENAAQTRQWLATSIQSYKQQILAASELKEVAKKCTKSQKHPALSTETVAEIKALKVKQLQALLKERGLVTVGVKKDLRKRLLEAMQTEAVQVENAVVAPPEPVHDNHAMGISPVKAPMDPPALNPASPKEREPLDHESISPHSVIKEPQAALDDPMQVEEPVVEESLPEPFEHVMEEPVDASMDENGDDNETNAAVGPSYDEDVPMPPASGAKRGKRSRSPLKLVQSGVQSAIKLFSKSPKAKGSSFKKPAPVMLEDLLQSDAPSKPSPTFESMEYSQPESTKPPSKVSESDIEEEQPKSGGRLLDGPAIGGSLSASKQAGSGVSALKSSIVKAKNEARKAKLAEIRGKSKPVVSKPLATPNEFSSLSSLKLTGNSTLSASKEGKRKLLAAQMREKAAATKLASQSVLSSVAKVPAPLAASAYVQSLSASAKKVKVESKKLTPQSVTSQQSIMSPLDTYELSDKEASDSDSDSEDDSGNEPKKRIPSWAQKPNLIPALEKQFTASRNKYDPDQIFGEVQTCDLTAIFDQKKTRYQRRTSSGNWNQDRATAAEKLTYKRKMGYTAQQA